MRKPSFLRAISAILALPLTLLLVHCAPEVYPNPYVFADDDGAALSGRTAEDGSRYTGGNDPRVLEMKPPAAAPRPGSLQLVITGLELSSPEDQLVDILKVRLNLPTEAKAKLHFTLPRLAAGVDKKTIAALSPKEKSERGVGFEISGTLERKSSGVVEGKFDLIRYSQMQPRKVEQDRAQILLRAYQAVTRFRPRIEPGKALAPNLDRQINQTRQLSRASVQNFTVIQGAAFYQVDLHDQDRRGNMRLTGEAKQTGAGKSFPTAARTGASTPAPQHVELIGNPGNVDGTAFLFSFDQGEESTSAVIEVVSEKLNQELDHPTLSPQGTSTTTTATSPPVIRGMSENAFIRTRISADLPLTEKSISHFDRNFSLPNVQKKIREIKDPKSNLGQQFRDILQTALNLVPSVEAIYSGYDIPPPMFLLTLRESRFFKRATLWQLERPGPNEDSLGPMQIQFETAKTAQMKVYPNGKGNPSPVDWDERLYVVPSMCGAATFLSGLLRDFSISDATLGIMGYNTGQYGTVRRVLDQRGVSNNSNNGYEVFRANISRYQLTYVEAVRLGTLEKDRYEYVDTFLAYYFVNGDLKGNNIELPRTSPIMVPENRLVPKAGIFSSKCSEIWKALQPGGARS